jgi:hypothetical protein
MSPPSFTYAFASRRPSTIAAKTSSATAPATAAIGVMNSSASGRHASSMRRATAPSTPGWSGVTARRNKASSSTSSDSTL